MASSTSHFKTLIPVRALASILTAIVAWAAASLYTVRLNPEMSFLRKADSVKRAWAKNIESAPAPKIVVYGGSSCMTSIIPERMRDQHGLRVLNMGLYAGLGPKILTHYAVQSLKPGDTLIVAIEPYLLTTPQKFEPAGIQFCFTTGNEALLRDTPFYQWPGTLMDLRPGGYHVLTRIAKLAARQPLYRYSQDEIHPDGWQEVDVKMDFPMPSSEKIILSKDAGELLASIYKRCATQHVRVAYSLPWLYCPKEEVSSFRLKNLDFAQQISEFMPVLKEPGLSLQTNRELFADSPLHPLREGAILRTDELSEAIKNWNTWSAEELRTAVVDEKNSSGIGK